MAGQKKDQITKPRYDWVGPWIELLALLNIILRDGVGAVAIVAFARGVETAINYFAGHPWSLKLANFDVQATDIVHYGDLFVLTGFIVISVYETIHWMRHR